MNQNEDIEKQYSPSLWSHRFDAETVQEKYCSVLVENSKTVKNSIPCELAISYSNSDAQKVDIFGAKDLPEDAPIFVYVHGGYWIFGSREDSSYFVKPFYEARIVCAVLGYDLVSDTVTIPDIVSEIVKGIDYTLKYASARKSKGVYMCGHSAGAHLIMMALSSGSFHEDDIKFLKGVIPVSGLYDLNPLLKHSVSEEARITKEVVDVSSPITVVEKLAKNLNPATLVLVAVAEHDSPAFRMQSQKYEESLQRVKIKSEYLIVEDEDHFSIIENLKESDCVLTKNIIRMIYGN